MKTERHTRINLKMKFTTASIILALVLSVVLIAVSYSRYKDAMEDRYAENIGAVIRTASAFVDGDKVDLYLKTGVKDRAYRDMYTNFKIIQKESGLKYLYCYQPTKEGLDVIVQGTTEGDEFHYDLGKHLDLNYYSQEDIDTANKMLLDPNAEKVVISDSKFGYFISAFQVISNSKGEPVALVGADMSMAEVNKVLKNYIIVVSTLAFLIISVFTSIYISFLRRKIVNPVQTLVNSAIKFVDTGYDGNGLLTSMNVNIKTGDEIEDLAMAFNKMTEDIVKYINDLTTATSERERNETELRVAKLIQEGMLPKDFDFINKKGVSLFASMRAAKSVGGDFYDFFFVDKSKICFVIGDVSGKGVPAALFMAMAKVTVKELAMQDIPVDEVMYKANNILCKNNEQGMFVTLYVAMIDLKTGFLEWCDGGHSPALLWKKADKSVAEIQGKKGLVVGCMEDYLYQKNSAYIDKGDIIYIYTDGVSEAINHNEEMYGEERLKGYIASLESRNVNELCQGVVKDVDRYVGEEPQFDDITMLALEFNGLGEQEII